MTTTLVILAATMGNRYGGLKYLEEIGPHGETILDYSVYDAVKVGFDRIVFVISRCFEEAFKATVAIKYQHLVQIDYVYQDVEDVSDTVRNSKRALLWGSAHAVLRCSEKLADVFGVINAVNFYQRESFELLYNHLQILRNASYDAFMVGYRLMNVMPESGAANRGICQIDAEGNLMSVRECAGVERTGGQTMYKDAGNTWVNLDEQSWVSMNMWGFSPKVFPVLCESFGDFLQVKGQDLKSAYILPDFVNDLIARGRKIKNVPTASRWMALVSPDDKIQTLLRINELIRKGVYPAKLFE